MARIGFIVASLMPALAGCSDPIAKDAAEPALKPSAMFEAMPLSGNLATALAAGFGGCLDDGRSLRCVKDVSVMGVGPLKAAVDLMGAPARFDHVTLWHPADQSAMLELRPILGKAGWQTCLTADEERFWKPPSPLRLALDTNYWGKRRLVISAPPPAQKPYC